MILPHDFDFTQGNLQDYVDCHYRFYLRYVLRTTWPALVVDDALEFEQRMQSGARFHRLVQQYLLGIPEEQVSTQVDDDPNPDLRTWWQGFLTTIPPQLDGQRWVETMLTTNLAGQRLVAKYDLILAGEDGVLRIFDWKTAQKAPRKAWLLERIQTRLYRFSLTEASPALLGGEQATPEQIVMNYWFAPHPQTPVSLPYSRSEYDHDRADLARLVNEICTSEATAFVRTSDTRHCRFCVYRSHCDRGVAAGSLADFDDFDLQPDEMPGELAFEEIPEINI